LGEKRDRNTKFLKREWEAGRGGGEYRVEEHEQIDEDWRGSRQKRTEGPGTIRQGGPPLVSLKSPFKSGGKRGGGRLGFHDVLNRPQKSGTGKKPILLSALSSGVVLEGGPGGGGKTGSKKGKIISRPKIGPRRDPPGST